MMDPAIKLFGKTIPVINEVDSEKSPCYDSFESSNSDQQDIDDKEEELQEVQESAQEKMEIDQSEDHPPQSEENSINPQTIQNPDESEQTLDSETKDKSNEDKNSQQKPLKKPDKILPCPRCNSMDTKFCYYNNYNINQPRHFCKSCQRYWTAGGTMRNVPVGAGRRKNKSSSSRYCHITVSEALNGAHHPGLKTNGTVLTFGPDNSPFCDRVSPIVNIGGDKQVRNGFTTRNGFHNIDGENGDDRSSGSTVTTSSMEENGKTGPQGQIRVNMNGYGNQMPCFQWPYMWNPIPPFCPSAFPMPFFPPPPPPYWNGPIPWNFPWVSPVSPGPKSPGSNPNSPTLGKHTRDGETISQIGRNEKSSGSSTVLVPKTLRIDDPDEAAKSSIWNTLGIKKGETLSKGGGFFNSLPPKKGEEKVHNIEAPPSLKANPVALCRSMNFQESSGI